MNFGPAAGVASVSAVRRRPVLPDGAGEARAGIDGDGRRRQIALHRGTRLEMDVAALTGPFTVPRTTTSSAEMSPSIRPSRSTVRRAGDRTTHPAIDHQVTRGPRLPSTVVPAAMTEAEAGAHPPVRPCYRLQPSLLPENTRSHPCVAGLPPLPGSRRQQDLGLLSPPKARAASGRPAAPLGYQRQWFGPCLMASFGRWVSRGSLDGT